MMSRPPTGADAADTLSLASELRVVIGRLVRRVREQPGAKDLTPSQFAVLRHLEQAGPATVSTLARVESMKPQSMGAIVASLEQQGLVSSAPHPTDGRQTLWSMTAECREWLATIRAAREDWLFRAIRSHLSAPEEAELLGAVHLLKRLADS